MSSPDPDDSAERHDAGPARPAENRPGDSPVARRAELPSDVDAAFAAIVSEWAAADAPHWPATSGGGEDTGRPDGDDDGPSSGVGTATPPSGWVPGRDPRTGPNPVPPPAVGPRDAPPPREAAHRPHPPQPPEDEFVPPEPPPLPRPRFGAVLGLALLVIGVVLLAVPGLFGGPVGLGIVPGLLAMTAGLGWLVLGLRRGREHDDRGDGPDDGAVV